jgi:hypothetical protein
MPYENPLEANKFEIIFDEIDDGPSLLLSNHNQPACKPFSLSTPQDDIGQIEEESVEEEETADDQ